MPPTNGKTITRKYKMSNSLTKYPEAKIKITSLVNILKTEHNQLSHYLIGTVLIKLKPQ